MEVIIRFLAASAALWRPGMLLRLSVSNRSGTTCTFRLFEHSLSRACQDLSVTMVYRILHSPSNARACSKVTAVVGDLAAHLGCLFGVSKSTTAITLVAMGTSLPDTFASRTAARDEETADASIGNVTGSNSVNVLLGLGLPWLAAAVYWNFLVPAGVQAHVR